MMHGVGHQCKAKGKGRVSSEKPREGTLAPRESLERVLSCHPSTCYLPPTLTHPLFPFLPTYGSKITNNNSRGIVKSTAWFVRAGSHGVPRPNVGAKSQLLNLGKKY